jgi:hypothetical protein
MRDERPDVELSPAEYRVIEGKRREPVLGPGWKHALLYVVVFGIAYGLSYLATRGG